MWYHYGIMPDVLIRDLDRAVLNRLKASAKRRGRSLQAEIHAILRQAQTRDLTESRRVSARWIARLEGRQHSDSTDLIREDLNSR
jgi:plasmid stability protein